MIYPNEVEQKLGFDQIKQRLKNYCLSRPGEQHVDQITFLTDKGIISQLLLQNLEFKMILDKGEDFPARHYHDPTEWLAKILIEGNYLEERELLDLANALQTIQACRSFLDKAKELYLTLFKLSAPITLSGSVAQGITEKIDDQANVRDSASPELGRIRRKLRDEQSRLRKLTDHIFRKALEEKWVPDGAQPTIRDGRLVIPIQAEHKRKLKGFIHDESATGQTIFLEPAEMLDTNNEIRDLEHAQRREVIRILKALTAMLHEHHGSLVLAFEFLATIDFIRAKAKLSVELLAEMPILEHSPALTWYRARHPLLFLSLKGKREVVPLEIDLYDDVRMLLVSGPNAGGKSVCLKTVGLIQYMLQCGFLVPLSDRSKVGIFDSIFLDIGDQQSIENDLSTYSSHLNNMNVFLRNVTDTSLVLLDELGSGTDPNFGGAIAEAVLKSLLEKKVWGVATTHYYNLKLFVGHQSTIRNAAMRFDDVKMTPLFLLEIGKPGSSFALEIARKTGLPEETLKEAERLVGNELAGFEKLVRSLERERVELAERVKQLEVQETELKNTLAKYKSLSSELELKKKDIIEKAKTEAQQLLKDTNREIEKTIRHIRENNAQKKETSRVRKNLSELSNKVKREERKVDQRESKPLVEGDRVRIIGQGGSGVVQVIKGKNAVVQFGEIKSVINLTKLERVTVGVEKELPRRKSVGITLNEKRSVFNSTLDIRGKRAEEVAGLLDQFMDTALLLGQGEIRILHGKGEGVLRKIVREHLKQYREVASIADEHVERGGDGISIIVLK